MHAGCMAAKKATSSSENHGEPIGGLFFAEEQQFSSVQLLSHVRLLATS